MPLPWRQIMCALREHAQSVGVVPAERVLWENDARRVVAHDSTLEIDLGPVERMVGTDDVDEVDGVPRLTGMREFTVVYRYRVRTPDVDMSAREALDLLRASFFHPVRKQALTARGIAFVAAEVIEVITQRDSAASEWEQVAMLEVRLAALSTTHDPREAGTPYAGAWVEGAEISGHVDDLDVAPFTVTGG